MMYAVGLENDYFVGAQRVRTSRSRAAEALGRDRRRVLHLKKKEELGPTFTRIAQELHSQYVLGFSPEKVDGKVHKLEVKLKRPGLTTRASKSYVAPTAIRRNQR